MLLLPPLTAASWRRADKHRSTAPVANSARAAPPPPASAARPASRAVPAVVARLPKQCAAPLTSQPPALLPRSRFSEKESCT